MLSTFVIGLREGLEASLIVGIIAAFLVKQGRRDVLRWVFVGVGAGVLLCTGVGVLLRVISQNLPQRQQEGLESVIGAIAVLMVTYMVVWMKRHSRDLKGRLEGAATSALAVGSGFALVTMAFLAVMREGFEPWCSCSRRSTRARADRWLGSARSWASWRPSPSGTASTAAGCG
jgi:high-affinity iron transporter